MRCVAVLPRPRVKRRERGVRADWLRGSPGTRRGIDGARSPLMFLRRVARRVKPRSARVAVSRGAGKQCGRGTPRRDVIREIVFAKPFFPVVYLTSQLSSKLGSTPLSIQDLSCKVQDDDEFGPVIAKCWKEIIFRRYSTLLFADHGECPMRCRRNVQGGSIPWASSR